jgi:hypothetical protein
MGTDEHSDRSGRRGELPQDSDSSQGRDSTEAGESPRDTHHRTLLLECLENPSRGVDRLPFILTLLESDDQQIRFLAAMTGCLVVLETDDEAIIEYFVRRLSDRLSGEELSLELTTALDYLTSNYPDQVEHLLVELHDELDEDMPLPEVGSFTRNYYYSQDFEREGIGRSRIAGADTDSNPHAIAEEDETEQRTRKRESEDESNSETETSSSVGGDNQPDPEAVAERSRFDQVNVEGEHYDGRYSMVYEMLVSRKGTQRALSLRILDYPPSTGDIHPFEKGAGTVLGEWAAVSDHPYVARVLDWGATPRPWVATAFTETTLLAREHKGFVTGLGMALSLTEAVAHLHQHDVVHGGIDARNVVFPGESFTDGPVEQVPLLDNVGLIRAYDEYVSFEELLAPQFTAPEHYSDQFGRLDHMTDIYQLGATCYYLFTGEFPYIGTTEQIRESVIDEGPPIPSAKRDDIPPAIDNIISKAMATEKIRRYETVEQFRQELDSVADDYRDTTS